MSDLLYLISEEGLPTFLVVIFLVGLGIIFRWLSAHFITRINDQFIEILLEVAEMQTAILEHNNKTYSIIEKLISNQREIQQDINALESSNDTLLKFINKNGKN